MIIHEERLKGVSPVIVCLVKIALNKLKGDFIIVEGVRTKERQLELFGKGRDINDLIDYMSKDQAAKYAKPAESKVTWTLNSLHLTGKAVDIAGYKDNKIKWERNIFLINTMSSVGFECGAHWKKNVDTPHYQINLKYPKRYTVSKNNTAPHLTFCIQKALTRKGYPVKCDGIYGSETITAVKEFKADHGLVRSGRITRKTFKLLYM